MDSILSRVAGPSVTRVDARQAIEQRGARFLGKGQATLAYGLKVRLMPKLNFPDIHEPFDQRLPDLIEAIEEEHVLRVSRNDPGGRATLEIAMKHQDDPYAPKVYDIVDLRDGWASEMEKLDPSNVRYPRRNVFDSFKFDWDLFTSPPPGWGDRASGVTQRFRDISPFVNELAEVRESKGYEWDLHAGNIAFRGNGKEEQLVLLDPLYGEQAASARPNIADQVFLARLEADFVQFIKGATVL